MEVASVGDSVELTTRKQPTTLLAAITALGLLVGVLGLVLPGVLGERDQYKADRQAVVTRSEDFATTFNTFKANEKADYQRRLKPLMTKKYYSDTRKFTDAVFSLAKDKGNISSGHVNVRSVAVDSMDSDSAVGLVAFDAQVRRSGQKQPILRQFRWQITLNKVGKTWLVSEVDTVPAMEATMGDVTENSKGGSK